MDRKSVQMKNPVPNKKKIVLMKKRSNDLMKKQINKKIAPKKKKVALIEKQLVMEI